jgi:hypothetical protein
MILISRKDRSQIVTTPESGVEMCLGAGALELGLYRQRVAPIQLKTSASCASYSWNFLQLLVNLPIGTL